MAVYRGRSSSTLDEMRTRQEYDRAFAIVRDAIARWDPYDLLASGSTTDEFDGEVAAILSRLRDVHTPADVAAAISVVFSGAFQKEGFEPTVCVDVGADVFARLQSEGLLFGTKI